VLQLPVEIVFEVEVKEDKKEGIHFCLIDFYLAGFFEW
jgi:hypothetical protein